MLIFASSEILKVDCKILSMVWAIFSPLIKSRASAKIYKTTGNKGFRFQMSLHHWLAVVVYRIQ